MSSSIFFAPLLMIPTYHSWVSFAIFALLILQIFVKFLQQLISLLLCYSVKIEFVGWFYEPFHNQRGARNGISKAIINTI